MRNMNILSMSILLYFFGYSRTDTTYYSNKQIEVIESFDKKDQRHGKRIMYYKNGQLASISFWKHDERDNSFITWHENGFKETKAFIKQGKSHGWRCNWDSLGFLVDSTRYDMGKMIEDFNFFKHSKQISTHRYFFNHPKTGKRLLAMEDQFNSKAQLISQIRNGNGISFDIKHSGRYDGIIVYKKGEADFMDYINVERHPKDPRHKRVPIPKSKQLPWNVKKYGTVRITFENK